MPSSVKILFIEIKSRCDLDCIFCRRNTPLKKFSELNNLKMIVDDNLSEEIHGVRIGSDEPLSFPHIINLIAYIRNKMPTIDINVYTAGIRLKNYYFLKKLIDAGVNNFEIPVYGYNAKWHDFITQKKGSFAELVTVLKQLKKYPEINVTIHTVLLRQNYLIIPKIDNFLNSMGYKLSVVLLYVPTREINYKKYIPDLNAIRFVEKKFKIAMLPYCLSDKKKGVKKIRLKREIIISMNKMHDSNFIKEENCKTCRVNKNCSGIPREYIEYCNFALKPIK